MGKSTQPLLKRCKALGINPLVMGYSKESKRNQKEVRRGKNLNTVFSFRKNRSSVSFMAFLKNSLKNIM